MNHQRKNQNLSVNSDDKKNTRMILGGRNIIYT